MTLELQETLEREMNDALAIPDRDRRDDAVQTVQTHMLRALVDCQRKTSERVKELVSDRDKVKAKLEGAKILWAVLRYLAAGGAGAGILQLLAGGAA